MMNSPLRRRDVARPDGTVLEPNRLRFSFPAPDSPAFPRYRALIVGTGRLASLLYDELRQSEEVAIVGAIDSEPQPHWSLRRSHVPLLGSFDDLQDVILSACIDEVHVALPMKSRYDEFSKLAEKAGELGVPITFHLSIFEEGVQPALRRTQKIAAHERHPSRRGLWRASKRFLDVSVALLALLLLSAPWILAALAIKLTSRGPVLFRQPRIGLDRRQFMMLKFRTMVENAEHLRETVRSLNNARGISFKVFQDPRVTRVGRFLRRTSLDELPQLINVLRGEMSLVGPRPIPTWVAEQLNANSYFRRFAVMPGLTGLWQVEGREQDFDSMAAQDLRYIEKCSFAFDLKILFKTLPAVVRGEGAH